MRQLFLFLLLIISLFHSTLAATPLTTDKIPDVLKPWTQWVLLDQHDYPCPFIYNAYTQKRCAWASTLNLDLQPQQGQFTSSWEVFTTTWIQLPGNEKYWPQNVSANGKSVSVINQNGIPQVQLEAGVYQLKGVFFWDRIPESLKIPQNSGLISLTINGKNIPYPAIKNAAVWLKESDIGEKKTQHIQNKLDIQVFRKINDDVPLQVTTHLELEVSGHQREIKLSHALLRDFIPISLNSPLPAKIEADGSLSVQVRAGRWSIILTARHPLPLKALGLKMSDKKWPESELWVFEAQTYQRLVEIENLEAIDPSQTNLPKDWKSFPAYQVKQGDVMEFKIIRRGDPEPEPNRLSLQRELWLDFDGGGYTIQDQIHGKMTSGWRLNALPETQLGQVKLNNQSQVITQQQGTNQQGVEVRKGDLNLKADSRFTADISSLSAVGWQQNFHQVSAKLNLPPGWRLFAATGIDNVPESWISAWTLLDLFVVLIVAFAIGHLWSWHWGALSLITLALIWHEPDAPRYIWLNIIAASALIKVLPQCWFLTSIKWYRNFCWFALIMIVIPFLVDQVRMGIYPQLEKPWQNITSNYYPQTESDAFFNDDVNIPVAAPALSSLIETEEVLSQKMNQRGVLPQKKSYSAQKRKAVNFNRIDPNANVQTGLGAPQWNWNTVTLSWNGTVDSEQKMKFWLLSPTVTMLLNFVRAVLVTVLSLLMFGFLKNIHFNFKPSAHTASVLLLLIPLLSFSANKAFATEIPSPEMLEELKTRLLITPECVPNCAEISNMSLKIDAEKMTILLELHAQQKIAVPLPANYKHWFPNEVMINGKLATAMIRDENGHLWLSVDKGIHQIKLSGLNPVQSRFTLPLILKPHHVKIEAETWSIEGLHENGIAENQLQFNRLQTLEQQPVSKQSFEQGILPPFIRIEKTLELGLDWRLSTRIIKLIPSDAPILFELPLLKGESVITPEIRVKHDKVQVNMSAREMVKEWHSLLEKTEVLKLTALQTSRWTESWRVDVSPIWHLETEGISVVHHQDQQGNWLPEWRPWAGETVTLKITRPKAVTGRTLTIDNTKLTVTAGKRSQEIRLEMRLRSSKGSQHTIELPKDGVLQSVSINGKTQPIRQKGQTVSLPIKPGKQQINLIWQQKIGISTLFQSPTVNLGLDSVNSHINIKLGEDRWVLFTAGPPFGPAVLFWGVLLVIIFLAIGLGRFDLTPVKHWQWFLLLIGLSQVELASALIVVSWFFALGYRQRKYSDNPRYFNLAQIGLAVLSFMSIVLLIFAVREGLLGSPDMQIIGNLSNAFDLNWYQDRNSELLPITTVISLPLTVYRILMLLWSLWLAISLLKWLKWGWKCFSTESLWRKKEKTEPKPAS